MPSVGEAGCGAGLRTGLCQRGKASHPWHKPSLATGLWVSNAPHGMPCEEPLEQENFNQMHRAPLSPAPFTYTAPVASAEPVSRPVTGRGFISLPRTASTLYLSKILHGFCHLENDLPSSPRSVQGTPLPQALMA